MKAIWKGATLAHSDKTVVVEGNHYFPAATIRPEYFRKSDTNTFCHWKGQASYYDIVVGDQINQDAAWYYADPMDAAKQIKDHVAFWKGVQITAD